MKKQQLDTRAGHVRSLLRDLRPATGPTITIGIMHPDLDEEEGAEDIDPETGKPRRQPGDDDEADEDQDADLFPAPGARTPPNTKGKGMKK